MKKEKKKEYRRSNSYVCGVLGGLAKYLDVDPLPVRLLFLLFYFYTPVLGILYFATYLLSKEEEQDG